MDRFYPAFLYCKIENERKRLGIASLDALTIDAVTAILRNLEETDKAWFEKNSIRYAPSPAGDEVLIYFRSGDILRYYTYYDYHNPERPDARNPYRYKYTHKIIKELPVPQDGRLHLQYLRMNALAEPVPVESAAPKTGAAKSAPTKPHSEFSIGWQTLRLAALLCTLVFLAYMGISSPAHEVIFQAKRSLLYFAAIFAASIVIHELGHLMVVMREGARYWSFMIDRKGIHIIVEQYLALNQEKAIILGGINASRAIATVMTVLTLTLKGFGTPDQLLLYLAIISIVNGTFGFTGLDRERLLWAKIIDVDDVPRKFKLDVEFAARSGKRKDAPIIMLVGGGFCVGREALIKNYIIPQAETMRTPKGGKRKILQVSGDRLLFCEAARQTKRNSGYSYPEDTYDMEDFKNTVFCLSSGNDALVPFYSHIIRGRLYVVDRSLVGKLAANAGKRVAIGGAEYVELPELFKDKPIKNLVSSENRTELRKLVKKRVKSKEVGRKEREKILQKFRGLINQKLKDLMTDPSNRIFVRVNGGEIGEIREEVRPEKDSVLIFEFAEALRREDVRNVADMRWAVQSTEGVRTAFFKRRWREGGRYLHLTEEEVDKKLSNFFDREKEYEKESGDVRRYARTVVRNDELLDRLTNEEGGAPRKGSGPTGIAPSIPVPATIPSSIALGRLWYNRIKGLKLDEDDLLDRTALRIAPWFEELGKVALPFGVYALLTNYNPNYPILNYGIFAFLLKTAAVIFTVLHVLGERAPPEAEEKRLAQRIYLAFKSLFKEEIYIPFNAPIMSAISGIIISGSVVAATMSNLAISRVCAVAISAAIAYALSTIDHWYRNRDVAESRKHGIDARYAELGPDRKDVESPNPKPGSWKRAFWTNVWRDRADKSIFGGTAPQSWESFIVDSLKDFAGKGKVKDIVDLGAGNLYITKKVKEALPGSKVIAMEFADLDGKKRIPGSEGIGLVQASAEEAPFFEGKVDAAIASYLFEYVDDRDKAVREMRRMLRPGGRGVVVLHHKDSAIVKNMRKAIDYDITLIDYFKLLRAMVKGEKKNGIKDARESLELMEIPEYDIAFLGRLTVKAGILSGLDEAKKKEPPAKKNIERFVEEIDRNIKAAEEEIALFGQVVNGPGRLFSDIDEIRAVFEANGLQIVDMADVDGILIEKMSGDILGYGIVVEKPQDSTATQAERVKSLEDRLRNKDIELAADIIAAFAKEVLGARPGEAEEKSDLHKITAYLAKIKELLDKLITAVNDVKDASEKIGWEEKDGRSRKELSGIDRAQRMLLTTALERVRISVLKEPLRLPDNLRALIETEALALERPAPIGDAVRLAIANSFSSTWSAVNKLLQSTAGPERIIDRSHLDDIVANLDDLESQRDRVEALLSHLEPLSRTAAPAPLERYPGFSEDDKCRLLYASFDLALRGRTKKDFSSYLLNTGRLIDQILKLFSVHRKEDAEDAFDSAVIDLLGYGRAQLYKVRKDYDGRWIVEMELTVSREIFRTSRHARPAPATDEKLQALGTFEKALEMGEKRDLLTFPITDRKAHFMDATGVVDDKRYVSPAMFWRDAGEFGGENRVREKVYIGIVLPYETQVSYLLSMDNWQLPMAGDATRPRPLFEQGTGRLDRSKEKYIFVLTQLLGLALDRLARDEEVRRVLALHKSLEVYEKQIAEEVHSIKNSVVGFLDSMKAENGLTKDELKTFSETLTRLHNNCINFMNESGEWKSLVIKRGEVTRKTREQDLEVLSATELEDLASFLRDTLVCLNTEDENRIGSIKARYGEAFKDNPVLLELADYLPDVAKENIKQRKDVRAKTARLMELYDAMKQDINAVQAHLSKHAKELNISDEEVEQFDEQVQVLFSLAQGIRSESETMVESVNIGEVLDEIVERRKLNNSKDGVIGLPKFAINVPAGLPNVLADRAKLKSILWELFINSIKYQAKNITVNVYPPDASVGVVTIEVKDDGIGIKVRDLHKIAIVPEFRGEEAKKVAMGSGLGLSIVKGDLAKMGGAMSISSGGIRKGTEVHVWLKPAPQQELDGASAAKADGASSMREEGPHDELFASFIGSFNLLRSKAAPESMAKVNKVNELSAKEDSSKNGLILYADSILRTDRITDVDGLSPCTVLDIEEALKGVNLLRNIKLIIYARKESNGRILKDVLNGIAVSSGKTMDIEVVTSMDVSASTEQDEAKELSALMNHIRKNASVIGVNNGCLLGVIKGQTMDAKNLESKAEELRLPVVSLESEEGIYSFIQALEEILMMRNRAVSYWLKLLPPVAKISEAVREAYEEYVRRREELETKA